MPKLSCRSKRETAGDDPRVPVAVLELDGFIDAANYLTFEKALDSAAEGTNRFLIVDFTRVQYINSSGISALIRHHEIYRDRSGLLILAGVVKSVGLSMHLLGVTSLIPFVKDLAEGITQVEAVLSGDVPRPEGSGSPGGGEAAPLRPVVLRQPSETRAETGKVLVVSSDTTRFTRVLQLHFGQLNGTYQLLHDAEEALRRYDEIRPDLVVIDQRCDPSGEFVNRLKTHKDRSLTSIIKLYGSESDVRSAVNFKIWENDYLVDPFETLEFFSLTESELIRVPKDRKVFHQQVHFEFRTTKSNIEKAYRLSDRVIQFAAEGDDERTTLYAAVKEGIDNAVVHGNHSDPDMTIDVNFLVDTHKVTVIVEDQGEGFDFEYYLSRIRGKDAFEEAKKRILEEGTRGGLGILLMSRCTDRLEYSGGGNILRLEKNLGGSPGGAS